MGGEAAVIHSAFSSFTCGGPGKKNKLLPITQARTTILVQVPIYANNAVTHSNSFFSEVYITSQLLRVRASTTVHMHELWFALLIYLCEHTGEEDILTHQHIKTTAKGVSKDASLPNSK